MARLFISYRRQDDGVQYIRENLKKAHFAVWFDTENILLGDPDWQESIVRGIESSDAVVLCFSPRVLDSDPIRFEIRTAQSKNKPIFIVMLQPFANGFPLEADLRAMGLNERYQVMDFTRKDQMDDTFARLVRDLYAKGIRPSPQQIRQRAQEDLHEQFYLRSLIDRVGTVKLHEVNPDYDGSEAFIENVYVRPQTDLRLVFAIDKYDIEQWWICPDDLADFEEEGIRHRRLNTAQRTALDEAHAGVIKRGDWDFSLIEILVEERREALFKEENESRRSRMARLDRAYEVVALHPEQTAVLCRQLLLVGEAGTGKTTFLGHLTACLAGHLLPDFRRPLNHRALGRWTHGELTPVYIHMRAMPEYIEQYGWSAAAVDAYIQEQLLKDNAAFFPDLERDLKAGYGVLILDGLERVLQVPRFKLDERRRDLDRLLGSLRTHYDQCRILMTGRPEYFADWQPRETSLVRITGLSPTQRVKLAAQIYANRPVATSADTPQQLAEFLNQFTPLLRSNPRFVTLLSTVYPAKRGVLYRRTIDLLLDNWTKPSLGLPSIMQVFKHAEMSVAEAEAKLIDVLGHVAYETAELFPDRPPRGEALRSRVLNHLGNMGAYYGISPEEVRAYLSENASVLVGGSENFRFAHDDFRLYFLAEHILKQIKETERESTGESPLVRQLISQQPHLWIEPLEMIGDLLVEENNGSVQRVWDLLEDLLGDYAPDDPAAPSPETHADAVWTAARIAIGQNVVGGRLRASERSILAQLIEWLVVLIDTSGDLPRRAELGRMLGILGDPRPGVALPVDWVTLPAGSVLLDGVYPDNALSETAPHRVDLPAFQMARYPVTVAQYETFVHAGGYQQRSYWVDGDDDSGWRWAQGREHPAIGWRDPQWHIPNHPVIGITWIEAAAFCRWLSAQTGIIVRLPTVAEWVRAARGDSDRVYPYGNDFDPLAANTHLSGIGRTTAVGLFPSGSAPADLCGNVYEWCQDAVVEARLHNRVVMNHVLMGGSWGSYPGFCRIDARYVDNPFFATTYWGFRVMRQG